METRIMEGKRPGLVRFGQKSSLFVAPTRGADGVWSCAEGIVGGGDPWMKGVVCVCVAACVSRERAVAAAAVCSAQLCSSLFDSELRFTSLLS
jgi:hypothetical protein